MKTAKSDHSGRTAGRKPRADGLQSRGAILDAAARLATTHGLEGLSIGELAAHIGMSKSGLYAHFKSKEELELATIDTAAEIFRTHVLSKVPASLTGVGRVMALATAFFRHLADRVYPGGCFFATVAAQLAPRPGRARDRILQVHALWSDQFTSALEQARDAGEIHPDADVEQLVFEITAMMFRANFDWIITPDPRVLDQARTGIENVLVRVRLPTARGRRRSPAG